MSSYELLNGLSPAEKEVALKILNELSQGDSTSYEQLIYNDYKETPVEIDEFLHNKDFLGRGLIDSEGRFTIYPYWVDTFKKIFPTNLDTAYNTVILSGAIGIGKSTVAVICMLYLLYRMLCLKDPYQHYGLQPIDMITFSMLNLTMDAAKGVGWSKMQELLKASPWFLDHGWVDNKREEEWHPNGNIELLYGSQTKHIIGRAVFSNFLDEASFRQNQDINKQKAYAMELVSTADARMQSRFMRGETLPTLHLIASSKRTEQSFLESYIDMKRKNESKTTLIIDEPQWVIRTDKHSSRQFPVALGNKFMDSEVLRPETDEEELDFYRRRGYRILMVPMGYYENFVDDLDIALTDIAGISTTSAMSYISGERWNKCVDDNLKNPFTKEVITVGDAATDTTQYYEFFDLTVVDPKMKAMPLYIHMDMSVSGDKTGIAGTWIKGKKPPVEGQPPSKELFYQPAFVVAVKAPKGHQISFEKNRQFIFWLKEQGFNVKGVSTDTYQSYDTGQSLKAKGYNYVQLSMDRVNSNRICEPYQYLKSTIYEERIKIFPTRLLTEEIVGLKRDSNGKIDHDISGINSKDIADALGGSIYNASQNAEQYAYDHGETLETLTNFNSDNYSNEKHQITVDFEEELKRVIAQSEQSGQPEGIDFGLGRARAFAPETYYLSEGIVL